LAIAFFVNQDSKQSQLTADLHSTKNAQQEQREMQGRCIYTDKGYVIPWTGHDKLEWPDFQAKEKGSSGFAVATVRSNFGFTINNKGAQIPSGEVYVYFYCEQSWKNDSPFNDRIMRQVLAHEQKHFDIAEIHGRKFYKTILEMKEDGSLSLENLRSSLADARVEFKANQKLYDKQSRHSSDGDMQRYWVKKIDDELAALSAYSNYTSF